MIAKKYRLSRGQINFLLKKGAQERSRFFIIREQKNEAKIPQFCVIVSKKMDSKAVVRNRLRRQIYEAIRSMQDEFPKGQYVLIAKKSLLKATFEAIKQDLYAKISANS